LNARLSVSAGTDETQTTNQEDEMMDRKKIAAELLDGCPEESLSDHQAIADAIRRGDTLEDILDMPEIDRWPETHVWIKTQFEADRHRDR
jgi:hypothetical protein